jgi:hypothetical protein
MNSWKKLDNDRVYYTHNSGFKVIKPSSNNFVTIPFVCPVCELFMKDTNDTLSYAEYECCTRCKITWAEGFNKERWHTGWRPSEEEIKQYKKRRGYQ